MTGNGTILGIADDYVGNAALFCDGQPVFAAANERFSRKKGDAGFPHQAMEAALAHAGVALADVDQVVVANRTHFVYRLMKSRFEDYTHDFLNLKQKAYLKFHDLVRASPAFAGATHAFNQLLLGGQLWRRVALCDHHVAHACSGIATSGFEECLAISVDNLGDGHSVKAHLFRGGKLEQLQGSCASDSPGQFYGEITQILGFNPLRHAGKITGLAGHGDPEPAYAIMERLFQLREDGGGFRLLPSWQRWQGRGPLWKLELFSREDVAAAAQKRLEDLVTAYLSRLVERTGCGKLVLTGGVFANVKLNMAIAELPQVDALHVHPAMSDEGLSFGAVAWQLLRQGRLQPRSLPTAFLGPSYSDGEIEGALAAGELGWEEPPALASVVAALLQQGHVVARYDGRLEYGPRALGNRSILYRPDDPSVNDWLNQRLRRTEFMPYAPVSLWEDAERCYEIPEGALDPARFMCIALRCKPEMARLCPGVVHVDGTARPQLLRREECPEYYDIVREYKRRTGRPALVNTSFNMHEEPIVNTPADAVAAFLAAGLDYLVIGGRIAWDPRRPELCERIEDELHA